MSSSAEVDTAVGEAPAKVDVVQLLADKRRALNAARERYATAKAMRDEVAMGDETRLIDALKELIPILETDAAAVLEATGRKEAVERQKRIKSAAGSLRDELKEDDAKVRNAENELAKVNAVRTARARKYESLQAEANGLTDRFDLAVMKLEVVPEPPRIEVPRPWQYRPLREIGIEYCEDSSGRQRRDYTEISGSDGYSIIQRAGLRPFRPLTQQEKAVLEDKAGERRPDPVLAAAATEANALGKLGVPGGHIQRG